MGLVLTLVALRATADRLVGALCPDLGDPRFTLVLLKWFDHQARLGFAAFASPPFLFPEPHVLLLSDPMVAPGLAFTALRLFGLLPILAYNLLVIGSFVADFVALFWVARELGISLLGGLVAGAAGAFAALQWSQLSHLQILWAPVLALLLWTWHRFLTGPGPRTALAAFGVYAIQATGGLYLAYMANVPLPVLAIVAAFRGELRWRDRRALAWYFAVGALAAGIAAAVFLPYLEASRHGMRHATSEILKRSPSLLSFLLPGPSGWISSPALVPWLREEGALLAGYAATALALVGLFRGIARRRPTRRVAGLVAAGTLLLALGLAANEILVWHGTGPITWGAWRLPRVNPQPALIAVVIGVALLAAAVRRSLRLDLGRDSREKTFWLAALATGGVCLLLCLPVVYLPLSHWIPGLSSMRVPGRFFAFCLPTLAWLAGRGFDALRQLAVRPALKAALVGSALLLLAVEAIPRPPLWFPLPEEKDFPAVYRWLGRSGDIRAYAELPIEGDPSAFWRESGPMYFATLHWKPIFNGYSSFVPAAHVELARRFAGLPPPGRLEEMAALGIDAAVVRRADFEGQRGGRMLRQWTRQATAAGARTVFSDPRFEVLLIRGMTARAAPAAE